MNFFGVKKFMELFFNLLSSMQLLITAMQTAVKKSMEWS